MSVLQTLTVLLRANANPLTQTMNNTVRFLEKSEKEMNRTLANVGKDLGKNIGFDMPELADVVPDVDNGAFDTLTAATEQYSVGVNQALGSVAALNTGLEQNTTAATRSAAAMQSVIASAIQAGFNLTRDYGDIFLGRVRESIIQAQSVFAPFSKGTNYLTRSLKALNLVNVDLLGSMKNWNIVDLAIGPGRLVTTFDQVKFALFGMVPPVRDVAFAAQASGQALVEMANKYRQAATTAEGLAFADKLELQGRRNVDIGQGFQLRPLDAVIKTLPKAAAAVAGFALGFKVLPPIVLAASGAVASFGVPVAAAGAAMAGTAALFTKSGREIAARAEEVAARYLRMLAVIAGKGAYQIANIALLQLGRGIAGVATVAARTVSPLVQLASNVTRLAGNVLTLGTAFRKTATDAERTAAGIDRVEGSSRRASSALHGVAFALSSLGPGLGIMFSLGPASAASFGAVATAAEGVKRAVNFEQTKIAFKVLAGGAEQGAAALADLRQFANVTPFSTDETIAAGRALLGMGFAAKELTPALNSIGDIAAGLNIPFTELATLYGQFRAQSKIMTQDLRQLSTRGIPILGELAKQFGVTTEKVFEMAEDSQIGFEHIEYAFKSLTYEGGQFANLMAEQSETVGGLFSTLASEVGIALEKLGTSMIEGLNIDEALKYLIAGAQYFNETFIPLFASGFEYVASLVIDYFVPAMIDGFYRVMAAIQPVAEVAQQLTGIIVELTSAGVALVSDFLIPLHPYMDEFLTSAVAITAALVAMNVVIPIVAGSIGFLASVFGVILSPIGLVVIALSAVVAWIANNTTIFEGFGEKVKFAFQLVEYAIRNISQVWKVLTTQLAYQLVRIGAEVEHVFGTSIPAYFDWFGRNWWNLTTDFARGFGAAIDNIWTNAKGFFPELWRYIASVGEDKIDFVWTGILDGFKSTTEQLPEIAERQIGGVEQILKNEASSAAQTFADGFSAFAQEREKQLEKERSELQKKIDSLKPPKIPTGPAGEALQSQITELEKLQKVTANGLPVGKPPGLPPRPPLGPPPPPRAGGDKDKDRKGRRDPAERGLEAREVGSQEGLKAVAQFLREGSGFSSKKDVDEKQLAELTKMKEILAQQMEMTKRWAAGNFSGATL